MISPGTMLGSYRVEALVGQGGMGEVYSGVDVRLDRPVAIKVLSSHLSIDRQLRERFEREARAVSSLTHPHICTLYDVGEHEGTGYFVMELVEGESLADRLRRGPLPLDQVLEFGSQLADALAAAHRRGIVHRDLKPGNVMVTKSGLKLLDFGLAKRVEDVAVAAEAPTEQKDPLTTEGTLLGTFQYMAPEQLEGLEADARTDVFALGVVLYEMTTGRRAFEGRTRTSMIAAIVASQPRPVQELIPAAPAVLEHVIVRCLEKAPEDRWQSAHDVAEELRWAATGPSIGSPGRAERSPSRAVVLAFAGALLALAILAAAFAASRDDSPRRDDGVLATSIALPDAVDFAPTDADDIAVLAPDGDSIVFVARGADGKSRLWLRRLDDLEPVMLRATDGARHPFWSPDSRAIAFFANGSLKTIALDGSPPVTICPVGSNPLGGSWGADGTILFSPSSSSGIHRVSASDRRSVAVTEVDRGSGETTHRSARILPDGRTFLYLAGSHDLPRSSEVNAVYGARLGSPDRTLILRARSNVEYVDGHLFFVREGTLYAQRLDAEELRLEGEPLAIAAEVHHNDLSFNSVISVASPDRLLYVTADGPVHRELVMLDRQGAPIGNVRDPSLPGDIFTDSDSYGLVEISPDGQTLLLTIEDPVVGYDLWLLGLDTGERRRLTLRGSASHGTWSPDGRRVAFVGAGNSFFAMNVEGAAERELIWENSRWGGPIDWSPDGNYIAAWTFDAESTNSFDALLLPLSDEMEVRPLAATAASESPGPFSPDGRWATYGSDESGRPELYLVSFPDLRGRYQISTRGANWPVWAGERELWYRELGGSWVSVRLEDRPGAAPVVSEPETLFKDPEILSIAPVDDDRIVAVRERRDDRRPQIVLLSGWKSLLRKTER